MDSGVAPLRHLGVTVWSRFIVQQLSTEERSVPANGHSSFPGEFVICVTLRGLFRRQEASSLLMENFYGLDGALGSDAHGDAARREVI